MKNKLNDMDYNLEDAIHEIYGDVDPYDDIHSQHKNPITDMFEVSKIDQKYIELRHEFNDKIFYPVEIPIIIFKALCIGDVFLMTMSLKDGCWEVHYMSQSYETFETEYSSLDKQDIN